MKSICNLGISLLVLFSAIGLQTAWAGERNNADLVHYDPVTDHLSIKASEVSQMTLLSHLALKTGLEVSYDEQADRLMTIELTAVPLLSGLKQLLRENSHILHYGKDKAGKKLLTGVIVLPEGKSDISSAHRLLKPEAEAFYHADRRAAMPAESTAQAYDHTQARWGARLAEMPPELQQQLQKLAEEKLAREQKQQAKQQKRAERQQKIEARRAERKNKEEQQAQQWHETLNPEQRAEWEQRQAQQEELRKAQKKELDKQVYQQLQSNQ